MFATSFIVDEMLIFKERCSLSLQHSSASANASIYLFERELQLTGNLRIAFILQTCRIDAPNVQYETGKCMNFITFILIELNVESKKMLSRKTKF